MEIERNHWQFNRDIAKKDMTVSLFSRFRLIELPIDVRRELPDELKKELKSMKSIRRIVSSHSRGLDLLYLTIFIYALSHILW